MAAGKKQPRKSPKKMLGARTNGKGGSERDSGTRRLRNGPPEGADIEEDALDFTTGREMALRSKAGGLLDDGDASDEEEDQEILGLDGSRSSDSDISGNDDDDDDEEWEEDTPLNGVRVNEGANEEEDDDDDDDDDDDGDGAARLRTGWGTKKRGFYGGAEEDDDDDDEEEDEARAARLEEKEVLALQRKQAAQLRLEDFGDLPSSKSDAAGQRSSDKLVDGGVRMESVVRDARTIASMSQDEQQRLLEAEAPELTQLLAEFKEYIAEARGRLEPLLSAMRKRQLPQSEGVFFLQLKLQLLLNYCINIAFYLMLKANGRSVREHPVINALLRHRVLIERLRPIEHKLKGRLQKLLQLASSDGAALPADQEELQFKPNPQAMLTLDGADESEDEGEDGEAKAQLYKPPKMAAVHYDDEPGASKKRRQQERALARASASRMVRELRDELSEAPRRIHSDDFSGVLGSDSQVVSQLRHAEAERRAYEEDNFTRLHLSKSQLKEERRKRNATQSFTDELQAFDDFSHLYKVASAKQVDPREEKLDALRQYMSAIEQRSKKSAKKAGGDESAPAMSAEAKAERREQRKLAAMAKRAREGDDDGDNDGDGGNVSLQDDPLYVAAEQKAQQKKQRRASASAALSSAEAEERRQLAAAEAGVEGEKREAGRQIMKNRGLTRERKKIDRNPRVKNREKFRKAVIRRKGQVREVRAVESNYSGEASGIKKNVTHSTKFK